MPKYERRSSSHETCKFPDKVYHVSPDRCALCNADLEQRERTDALKKQSEQGEVPAEVTAEGSVVYASEENREVQTDTEAQTADKAESSAAQTSKEEAAENLPIAISCRGESWAPDDNDKEDGWPAILSSMLEENGVSAAVSDYTWDMAGTLSQMRFADVPEETVDSYIEAHNENGLRGYLYETTVRDDLEESYIERDDYESIPVICIGYNGGYGVSSAELIEQQSLILNTYTLQAADAAADASEEADQENDVDDGEMGISGKYLIVGHLPAGWRDLNNYETRMKNAWGDHFVSLNEIEKNAWGDHFVSLNEIEGDVVSRGYREAVADTIYNKLVEMGYCEVQEQTQE